MSIRYDQDQELRYIKYQNLLQESRIMANYYRDQIHSYGIDCTYYKSTVNLPPQFSKVLTSNNILRQAYGFDPDIDFSLSADLITFQETETDIFTLDRIGNQNSQKTFFYFDLTEFATTFMTKLGQFKEYAFESQEISGQLNEHGQIEFTTAFTCNALSLSGEILCKANVEVGGGGANIDGGGALASNAAKPFNTYRRSYTSNNAYNASFEKPAEGIAHCLVTNHTEPVFTLPVNEYIARSFNYKPGPGEFATIAYFKYTLNPDGTYTGILDGTILYYDLQLASDYAQQIRPDVGDIIAIHTAWGEMLYDVNAIQDQDMTNEGLNPLLHKYIWKISAQRHIDSYEENSPEEESTILNKAVLIKENQTRTDINNIIEDYADGADRIYGGFTGASYQDDTDDKQSNPVWDASELYTGTYMNIITFGNGSELITDGINLFFKNTEDLVTKLSTFNTDETISGIPMQLRYLKATKANIYFQNIDGDLVKLIGENSISLSDKDQEVLSRLELNGYNSKDDNFFKFVNCHTILFSSPYCLYAKPESSDTFIRLA